MSALKYRLRKLLPRLSEQAKQCQDRQIKQRLYVIKGIVSSQRTLKGACEFRGVCRDTFYRWAERLEKAQNIKALKDKSKKPHHSPWQTSPSMEQKIKHFKKKYPYMGPERIAFELEKINLHCPPSTIYSVLKRAKLISKKYRSQRTKKHTKRYRQPIPGFLQMDFKYVPYLVEGQRQYQLSAIDHCTSWRLIRCFPNKGEEETLRFLQELWEECPFQILEIQTDNDVAFTDKYTQGLGIKPTGTHPMDRWCFKKAIRHKLIPVGEKELNGKVENSHKFDDEEFYSQCLAKTKTALYTQLYLYNQRWNSQRATKSLHWKTPEQTLRDFRLSCYIIEAWFASLAPSEPVIQPPLLESKTIKKIDPLDRYLRWMDWDAAQYHKSVSWISISYSRCQSPFKLEKCLSHSVDIFH